MPMELTVADIMTDNLITLREEDNLSEIGLQMELFSLRHMPVVSNAKLVGLLTHRDVLRYSLSTLTTDPVHTAVADHKLQDTFVASIMTTDVQTVRPDTSVSRAAHMLVNNRYGCLPVTSEDGTLLGIVTEFDFLQLISELRVYSVPPVDKTG